MSDQVTYEIITRPAIQIAKAKIPDGLLSQLIDDAKTLSESIDKLNYKDNLVGNFSNGEQIEIKNGQKKDWTVGTPSFEALGQLQKYLGLEYIAHYCEAMSFTNNTPNVEVHDVWLNVQKAGDFNPVHNHNAHTVTALASFAWLTFPDCVMDNAEKIKSTPGATHDARELGGMTELIWGVTPNFMQSHFMFPKLEALHPEPGVVYLFPSWLQHIVYPFKGPGTRLSIATNLNVWGAALDPKRSLIESAKEDKNNE